MRNNSILLVCVFLLTPIFSFAQMQQQPQMQMQMQTPVGQTQSGIRQPAPSGTIVPGSPTGNNPKIIKPMQPYSPTGGSNIIQPSSPASTPAPPSPY